MRQGLVLATLTLGLLLPLAAAAKAPVIVVTAPAAGQAVRSGFVVRGTANVFEANVTVELYRLQGSQRKLLARSFTTASCGTGCRGHYRLRVRFHVPVASRGLLVVHDDDAAGVGHPPHVVRVSLRLLPG
jgi:hypothetical protein